jgi:uncharacterized protein YlxW (UPF0749 family)
MNGGQIMVVLIVAIVMIAGIIKSKHGVRHGRQGAHPGSDRAIESAETQRLRDEVKQLKERLAVIERITVEKENSLEREIEQLRNR